MEYCKVVDSGPAFVAKYVTIGRNSACNQLLICIGCRKVRSEDEPSHNESGSRGAGLAPRGLGQEASAKQNQKCPDNDGRYTKQDWGIAGHEPPPTNCDGTKEERCHSAGVGKTERL